MRNYLKSIRKYASLLKHQPAQINKIDERLGTVSEVVQKIYENTSQREIPKHLLKPIPAFRGTDKEAKIVGHENLSPPPTLFKDAGKRSDTDERVGFWTWLGTVAPSKKIRVLEIGSRAVVTDAWWKKVAPDCDYVGFDYIDGENVDVVGDVHRLSEHFDDESFDVVISFAVFEHLAMPWVVAEEISKVLKVGGYVATETHFAFAEHEMPWNFFQFHYEGLKYLFNPALGFDVKDAGFSNPLVAWFSDEAEPYLVGRRLPHMYCHSNLLVQKQRTVLNSDSPPFDWRSTVERLQSSGSYPKGSGLSAKKR